MCHFQPSLSSPYVDLPSVTWVAVDYLSVHHLRCELPRCSALLMGYLLATLRRYLHVPNPMYDYVAPELVSLFVTDTGGYQGSYVYRLLAEYYTRDDYLLSEDFLDQLVYSS